MMYNKKFSSTNVPKLGQTQFDSIFYQLLHKLDQQEQSQWTERRLSLSAELRTLEFWRAIIAECLASFFYVFLVCAVHISWTGSLIAHQPNWLVMSFTSGFAMATLSQCFGHISGAHVNPAVTIALLTTRRISILRAIFYVIAQCGGSIAGSALLYGVSVPSHQGALGVSLAHEVLSSTQIFAVEFVLSFLIVFTVFSVMDPSVKSLGSDSLTIGLAYLVCSLAGLPSSGAALSPTRALGPCFVMSMKWRTLWIYWAAPILGGILAALIYEFIFDTRKMSRAVRDAFEQLERDSQKDHYDEPTELKLNNKSILAYSNSQHSSASSSGSSSHPSQLTGYSTVQSGSANGFNPSNSNLTSSFQHTVLTHDSIYPPPPSSSTNHLTNNLANNLTANLNNNLSGQFNLNNSHNVGIYSTTSRLTPSLRTLAYGNNLNTKY